MQAEINMIDKQYQQKHVESENVKKMVSHSGKAKVHKEFKPIKHPQLGSGDMDSER